MSTLTFPEPADVETPAAQTEQADQIAQFTIDNDGAAEWLLRRLGNLEAERARVTAQAAAILKQIDNDAERLNYLFGAQLETYCRAKLAASGNRRRSLAFLQGTCSLRTVPAGLRISDSSAAFLHAKTAVPDAIRTVETLDSTAYRETAIRHLQETGEVLPGMETTPEREAFSIKTR